MGGTALALVLSAAVLHAVWNLAAKGVRAGPITFVWLYTLTTAVIWVPIGVVWVLVTHERPHWSWLLATLVSAVFHIGYQLVLQFGYRAADLNLVYPLARGSGPLLTFVVAVSVLGERPAGIAVVGVAAVLAGVVVIAVGGHRSGRVRAGVFWGVLTGATIACYTLWDDHSVTALGVPALPYFVLDIVMQLPFLTAILPVRLEPTPWVEAWRAARWRVLAVATLSPLAYVLVLRAMQLAPVALVAPARETSIVIGALFGWLVLREPRPARRLAGAAIVLVGIALIAVG